MDIFEITPCEDDVPNETGFTKLNLSSVQKMYTNALFQQLPVIADEGIPANAYTIQLPDSVSPADLMYYINNGGANQAVVINAFSAMSIASGQYYLSEINSKLTAINQKADKILEFLYGNKKAELTSEVKFVNFAYQNYNSIMGNDMQRAATIVNIQAARKVAMKDVEFYMSDLDYLAKTKDISDLNSFVKESFQTKDCLQLAIQLYSMSNVLEVCYSQNIDASYIKYVEKDIFAYIDKCEKRMLSDFAAIQMRVENYRKGRLKKAGKSEHDEQINEIVDLLENGGELIKRKPLQSILYSYQKGSVYYVNREGDVYLKTV